jgi:hypothetical protein
LRYATPNIEVNGETIAELPSKTYTVLKLPPGIYTVRAGGFFAVPAYHRFTAQPGKSYYIQVWPERSPMPAGMGEVSMILLLGNESSEVPPIITECSLISPQTTSIPLDDPTRRGLPARADGTALLAPAGLSYEERVRNVDECFAQARGQARSRIAITPEQRALLQDRSTEKFFRAGRPVVNRDDTPNLWESAVGPPGGYQSTDISDRYVLCFLARGYLWPNPQADAAKATKRNAR